MSEKEELIKDREILEALRRHGDCPRRLGQTCAFCDEFDARARVRWPLIFQSAEALGAALKDIRDGWCEGHCEVLQDKQDLVEQLAAARDKAETLEKENVYLKDRLSEWTKGEDGEPRVNEDGEVCTCKPGCTYACKGQCGCRYCHSAYHDFLSVE